MMFEPKRKVRYAFNPSPHLSHVKMINYVGQNKRVLDVGCATGYLDKRFKENGCFVMGIEIDEGSAKIAKMFCDEVIVADVEEINELPYSDGFFDVIIYADILEHLRRPDLVLTKFKKYLADNGYLIACIPNIGYYRSRLKLLFGKFEYKDIGAFDVTHLRFFTLKTAKKLFESCGYKIIKMDYTAACSYLRRILPTLLAFQFIIIAKKGEMTYA